MSFDSYVIRWRLCRPNRANLVVHVWFVFLSFRFCWSCRAHPSPPARPVYAQTVKFSFGLTAKSPPPRWLHSIPLLLSLAQPVVQFSSSACSASHFDLLFRLQNSCCCCWSSSSRITRKHQQQQSSEWFIRSSVCSLYVSFDLFLSVCVRSFRQFTLISSGCVSLLLTFCHFWRHLVFTFLIVCFHSRIIWPSNLLYIGIFLKFQCFSVCVRVSEWIFLIDDLIAINEIRWVNQFNLWIDRFLETVFTLDQASFGRTSIGISFEFDSHAYVKSVSSRAFYPPLLPPHCWFPARATICAMSGFSKRHFDIYTQTRPDDQQCWFNTHWLFLSIFVHWFELLLIFVLCTDNRFKFQCHHQFDTFYAHASAVSWQELVWIIDDRRVDTLLQHLTSLSSLSFSLSSFLSLHLFHQSFSIDQQSECLKNEDHWWAESIDFLSKFIQLFAH